MVTHYIYEEPDKECLLQGDVLEREPEFCRVLQEIFPYYAEHETYRYFLVLTQSCDLARRDQPPSAEHITIAAVLPVEDVIEREALQYQEWWQTATDVVDNEAFDQLRMFTERLFDNNVDNYFYLHEDTSLGIHGQSCTSLVRSVALRIDHYDVCCKAKIAQLQESFRAKLGWLVGNIYSRIGTSEWNKHYGPDAINKEASNLLKDLFEPIGKEKIGQATSQLQEERPLKEFSPKEIYDAVRRKKVKAAHTRLGELVTDVITESTFVDQMASAAIGAIRGSEQFREDIRSILEKHETGNVKSALSDLTECFVAVLRSVLSDQDLPGRNKIVSKLSASISQDLRVRSLLR